MRLLPALLAILALSAPVAAAPGGLVSRLSEGGYVLVMRHAHAPGARPGPSEADPGNPQGERQLDQQGRTDADSFGRALKARRVTIGEAYSSPAYRAMQTVRLAGLIPKPEAALGDGGSSMAAQAAGASGDAWLKAKAAEAPKPGANTLLVTHGPNIARAFAVEGVADGEALVFRPDPSRGSVLVGRIKIGEWSDS